MILSPASIETDNLLNITLFERDGYYRIKSMMQCSIINDIVTNQVRFCFNTLLLSRTFRIVGRIGDVITFNQLYNNPVFPPQTNWGWLVAVGIAVGYLLDRFDYSYKVIEDGHGKVKQKETKVSWNSVTSGGSPDPKEFTTFDQQTFQADNCYIESIFDYSANPLPPILENKISMVQLTGRNYTSLTIKDYILS